MIGGPGKRAGAELASYKCYLQVLTFEFNASVMDDRHSDNDQPPPTTNDSPSTSDNLGVTISPVTLSLLASASSL